MAFQTVFKRYEIKYLLTAEQKQKILRAMAPYMVADQYGKTTVRNIYFDTDNFQLVRHSIDDPVYKEKLRVRSYGAADPQGTVFVELKKKYQKVVYKRRIAMPQKEAAEWMAGIRHCRSDSQISREIDYFLEYYKTLKPAVFLSYDRQAYYLKDCSEFRMTFDENILCRRYDINLESGVYGDHVLAEGLTLMEVKCAAGMPLWLTSVLSEEHIYKTSFSKYGMAYKKFIYPALKSGAGTSNNADEPKEAKSMLDNIFKGLFDSDLVSVISVTDFLLCLGCALVLGLVMAFVYMYRTRYTKSFVVTLALLPAVVCVVIMLVNGNVGTGVAVAGAFSLVRFRSVPGTAKEICTLFLAMGAGLIVGMGYLGYAVLFTVVLCAVFLLYNSIDLGSKRNAASYKIITVTIPEDLDYTGVFDDIFETYTVSHELSHVKTTNMGSMFRLTYRVTLRDPKKEKEMIDMLRCRNGNLEISVSSQESTATEL